MPYSLEIEEERRQVPCEKRDELLYPQRGFFRLSCMLQRPLLAPESKKIRKEKKRFFVLCSEKCSTRWTWSLPQRSHAKTKAKNGDLFATDAVIIVVFSERVYHSRVQCCVCDAHGLQSQERSMDEHERELV
jgi:hypothetical protein